MMPPVMNTRRQFLIRAPLGFLVTAAACRVEAPARDSQTTAAATPGAPPTFGNAAGVGPEVSPETFAEAEKLVQFGMTPAERQQAARAGWCETVAYLTCATLSHLAWPLVRGRAHR